MKNFLNNISSDKLALRGFLISFVMIALTIIYILINYFNLPPLVPVFNQLPWGEQRLVPTLGIFIPTIIAAFIFSFNIIFSSLVYNKRPLIARMVAAVTLIITLLNLLFVVKTIFAIG